jgi:hypothetical protein
MPFGDKDNLQRGHHVYTRLGVRRRRIQRRQQLAAPRSGNPIRDALTAGGWTVKEYLGHESADGNAAVSTKWR